MSALKQHINICIQGKQDIYYMYDVVSLTEQYTYTRYLSD